VFQALLLQPFACSIHCVLYIYLVELFYSVICAYYVANSVLGVRPGEVIA
jgi:hypothetical protein